MRVKTSTALDPLRKGEMKNFWLMKIMPFMLWEIFKKEHGAVVPTSKVLNSFESWLRIQFEVLDILKPFILFLKIV